MKKLINAPGAVVPEMLAGLTIAYPNLRKLPGQNVLARADIDPKCHDRVALISGGGSGHEPAHAGYVGRGMLSAAVAGDVFTSPPPDAVLAAIRAVTGPRGCLLIVKNYTGDRLNFGLAAERARAEGLAVEMVLVADDVALADAAGHAGRRGLAGTILVHKVAGAAAEAGLSLAEVAAEARAVAAEVRTMGVALAPCTVPAAGEPGFSLGEGEIEMGLGIHGEPGLARVPLAPADTLVDDILGRLVPPREHPAGRPVALMVNGLGGTPAMELAIVARRAVETLGGWGLAVERVYLGNFLTALEMAGVSLTLLPVTPERIGRLDSPTSAPAWPTAPGRPRERAAEPPAPVETGAPPRPSAPATEAGRALGAALSRVAEALLAAEPALTAADSVVGDGDLGISLARGARAILEALPTLPLDDPSAAARSLGVALEQSLGGTSGPLYAAFLARASAALARDANDWASALRDGCSAVSDLGGAHPGDRTMLDALGPASDALSVAMGAGLPGAEALRRAVEAARAGARATADMRPRLGRSSYLADRALGHPDPGAEAVAVWLGAILA
jgi:triose/dihydroxyacetone kinase / FAD-AMP lyase (cyclizing)